MNIAGITLIIIALIINAIGFYNISNNNNIAMFSQFLGASALLLMATGQVIATRVKGIESIFGSLDQSYKLHKWLGIIAFALFLLHDMIDAEFDNIPQGTLYDLAETIGEFSFNGLIFLIILSIIVFIPYHLWKWTHRFMGFMFTLSSLHFMLISKPFETTDPIGLYVSSFCLVGFLSYIYTLLPQRYHPWKHYELTSVRDVADATILDVKSLGNKKIKHKAGQFAFIRFQKSQFAETHPFTISSAPNADNALRFSIKALGDYTSKIKHSVAAGDKVCIQGPYGNFTRKPSSKTEIWIAGGIGITPFASWAQDLNADDTATIHLYYSVRDETTAVHLDELRTTAEQYENFNLHLFDGSKGDRLSVDQLKQHVSVPLKDARYYFCGPKAMRLDLKDQLAKQGVKSRHYHYEEFEMRSGIGLRLLLTYVLDRLLKSGYVSNDFYSRLLNGLNK